MIVMIGPMMPDREEDTFAEYKSTIDRSNWVGTGWTGEIPGGGNADNDGDTDEIERSKPATRVVVGPKSFIDGANK